MAKNGDDNRRVAIACQGGGSHTAFTAGVLQRLLREKNEEGHNYEIVAFFAGELADLPRPLLWIEHRPGRRRRGPGRYYLLCFATYRPKPEGLGFVKRKTLGAPERELLTPEEVAVLTGEGSRSGP